MIDTLRKKIVTLYKKYVAISLFQSSNSLQEQLPTTQTNIQRPASSSPLPDDAFFFAHHLRFDEGVQLINAQLVFVSIDDAATFFRLSERALFLDEQGLCIKLNGMRKHLPFV